MNEQTRSGVPCCEAPGGETGPATEVSKQLPDVPGCSSPSRR
jgi:hypothetical protein